MRNKIVRSGIVGLCAGTAAMILAANSAHASIIVVPHAAYNAYAESGSNSVYYLAPGSYSGGIGSVFYSIKMLPKQNYVSAFNNTFNIKPGGGVSAAFTFWFSVDGLSSPNTIIPMQIDFTTRIEGSGAYAAGSVISWPNIGAQGNLGPESQRERKGFCAGNINITNECTPGPYFQYTHYATERHEFYVQPNTAYPIELLAFANTLTYAVSDNNVPLSYSYAIMDPTISIDPHFSNANLYSVHFSAGVQNGSPLLVPEPSTLLLLGTGLLGLGFVRKPRHTKRNAIRN